MNLEEAVRIVADKTPVTNYMVLVFNESNRHQLVLPYEDGARIVALMGKAEQLHEEWGKQPNIQPINKDVFRVYIMPRSEYLRIQIANLMNVNVEEVPHDAIPF